MVAAGRLDSWQLCVQSHQVPPLDIRLEKRLAPRRNTMMEAELVFNNGRTRVNGIIRNLSDSGAKIEVVSVSSIPASFELRVAGHRPHSCRVVWRALREIGVTFS
jgi:PilZ domain